MSEVRRAPGKGYHLGVLLLAVVVVFVLFSVVNFYTFVSNEKQKLAEERLVDHATSNLRSIQLFFEGQQSQLLGLAMALEKFDGVSHQEAQEFLSNVAGELGYYQLSIDTFDGRSYASDGMVYDTADAAMLQRIRKGESFITDVRHIQADGPFIVETWTPICDISTNEPLASLHSTILCEAISQQVDVRFLNQECHFHLLDGTGNFVTSGNFFGTLAEEDCFFEVMRYVAYEEGFSYEAFLEDVQAGRSGFVKYHFHDDDRYAYYTPANINDWYVITVLSRDVVTMSIRRALANSSLLVLNALLAIAVLFGYIWVGQQRANQRSALDERCFRVLSEQIQSMIFEWNFDTGKITSTSNFEHIMGREPVTSVSEQEAILMNAVHRDDIENFTQIFTNIRNGYNIKDVRFRVRDAQQNFVWCTLSGVVIYDAKHRPYKAIGTLKNIDEEVNRDELLRSRAEKDLLTDLYNKISTQALVTEYLAENQNIGVCGALFMVDIDCFKGVNDNMGHQFGDQVLTETAGQLKRIFRTSDIIGRIGGDEFIIFMKDVLDDSIVQDRAAEICASFARLPSCRASNYFLTGSVGVSIFPRHGTGFDELYHMADLALYSAKNSGKNQFAIYQSELESSGSNTNLA